jgi:hypothetical protein
MYLVKNYKEDQVMTTCLTASEHEIVNKVENSLINPSFLRF